MKFKLDENLDRHAAGILLSAGYETKTVYDQDLSGASDARIARICRQEKRVLITLDKHFSNLITYPPDRYSGIIILRPHRAILPVVLDLVRELIKNLPKFPIDQTLWIVEPGRIRIHSAHKGEE